MKKKTVREANAEAQESLQEATAKLKSIKCQHQEQCAKLLEEKGALLVALDDEQTSSTGLRHERKSKEATIAQLSIQVQTLTRGSKALAEGIDELHEKLAATESKSKTDTEKWATERRHREVVAQAQSKELRAKMAINQVCVEDNGLSVDGRPIRPVQATDCSIDLQRKS